MTTAKGWMNNVMYTQMSVYFYNSQTGLKAKLNRLNPYDEIKRCVVVI